MPMRTTATFNQRQFLIDLFKIKELVCTIKCGEICSMNAHGSFGLFEKHWLNVEKHPVETMLVLKVNSLLNSYKEPPVHFHIDWNEIRYVIIRQRRLDLIDMDYEIVFCNKCDTSTRVFWFYAREDSALQAFIAKWGYGWINLYDNLIGISLTSELFENKHH